MTAFELTPTTPNAATVTAESRPGGVDLAVGRSYRWLTAEQAAELGAWLLAAVSPLTPHPQDERARLADLLRGHEAMCWPEEAHRLQRQNNDLRARLAAVEALADELAQYDAVRRVVAGRIRIALATPTAQTDAGGRGAALTDDAQANDCAHGSATGIDTAPIGPGKVWACDHCGLRWTDEVRRG